MLAIGSDHAGYELKCEVKKFLDGLGVKYIDCGCNGERADYPDIAENDNFQLLHVQPLKTPIT